MRLALACASAVYPQIGTSDPTSPKAFLVPGSNTARKALVLEGQVFRRAERLLRFGHPVTRVISLVTIELVHSEELSVVLGMNAVTALRCARASVNSHDEAV